VIGLRAKYFGVRVYTRLTYSAGLVPLGGSAPAFRQFTQIIWAFQKDGTSDIGFWPRIRGRATISAL